MGERGHMLLVDEIKNDGAKVALSSTELKKFASGGDTLKGRQNYDRSAQEFKLQGLPVVLCNDRPKIKPLVQRICLACDVPII